LNISIGSDMIHSTIYRKYNWIYISRKVKLVDFEIIIRELKEPYRS
jgi:hypothetical protein